MLTKNFLTGSLILIAIFLLLFLYFKYYQSHGIYHPTKKIHYTPTDIGLKYKEATFKSTNNCKLHGWFIPSENAKATLLFCHGNAGNISHRVDIIKIFHDLNLNVFIFDYRGYGKSSGKPSEKALYNDTFSAYRYLTKKFNGRIKNLVIYGKSIGGNIAIDLVSKLSPNNIRVKALVTDSAFTSAVDMGKEMFPFIPSILLDKLIYIDFNAISKIKKIYIPKLIIHSQNDKIVPFKLGKKLFKKAPKPKEFFSINGSHNESIIMYENKYRKKLSNFLTKHVYN